MCLPKLTLEEVIENSDDEKLIDVKLNDQDLEDALND